MKIVFIYLLISKREFKILQYYLMKLRGNRFLSIDLTHMKKNQNNGEDNQ